MKKILMSAAAIAAVMAFVGFERAREAAPGADTPGRLPVHFEPTAGADAFVARGAGFALELDSQGANLRLARGTTAAALSLRLADANPAAARPESPLPGVSNYFLGADPDAWRTRVPHYSRVRYENVYPGVDLVYHSAGGELEYDFEVGVGADPAQIRMRYEGARSLHIDGDGNLRLAVDGGELVHRRPVTYQLVDGVRRTIGSAFRLVREAGEVMVGFDIGRYDPRLPLVVDPVLNYATYLGGSDENEAIAAVAVDSVGAMYVAGYTNSADFPVTAGVVQPVRSGLFEVFVAKLNPAGTAFEYVTYLGGTGLDQALALRIDAAGNAFVAGETSSANFPVTVGAAQTAFGGNQDIFVARLNATGGTLLYSTYLGGTGAEPASSPLGGFELDATGNVYLYADTDSPDFPVSAGAPQPARGNPNPLQFDEDVTLTRINASGTAFAFSTYLGGSGIDITEDAWSDRRLMAIDGNGIVWIAGTTESADFPATAGAFDATFNGPAGGIPGGGDAFVARFDTNTGAKTWATFVGGTGDEFAKALAVDGAGNAFLGLQTASGDLPVSAGAPDPTYGGGSAGDGAVVKLDAAGSTQLYATYLGGGLVDSVDLLRVDATGAAYLAGETTSPNFPVTAGAADTSHGGGFDGFITKLNPAGTAFVYSTYVGGPAEGSVYLFEIDAAGSAYAVVGEDTGGALVTAGGNAHAGNYDDYFVKLNPAGTVFLDATYLGGAGDDYAASMVVDATKHVYLGGSTGSSNYPVTAGAPQTVKAGAAGDDDTFLAKLATTPAGPVVQPGVLALGNATFTVDEGAGTAVVTVTRTGGADGAVSVSCSSDAVGGDSATTGADFTVTTVTLNWADGDAAGKTCSIPVTDDADPENAETFTVEIGSPTGGATLGAPTTAAVSITDDDQPPAPQPGTVQFGPVSYSINENGGSVAVTLTRTAGADGAISVSVTSGGGSASPGSDYTPVSEVVSWADGDSAAQTVTLTILDDSSDEPAETITLTLSNATGGATLGAASATVTISDDEVPPPPVTQTTQARGGYGGSLDGVMVLMLSVAVLMSRLARRPRLRRRLAAALAPALVAAGLAPTASAADESTWYVGARAGVGESTQDDGDVERALAERGHAATASIDETRMAWSLFAGYRWSNGLALEGGYYDLGRYRVSAVTDTADPAAFLADVETVMGDSGRGVSAALAWTFELGEHVEITPRLGAYYWGSSRTVESNAGRISDREFGVDLMGGIRLDFRLDQRWSVGLGWECWGADSRNDVRVINAGFSYRVGK